MTRVGFERWFGQWWLLLVPALFAIGTVSAYALIFRALPATECPAAGRAFEDFIGGLMNPLVSILTLLVAVNVWRLQKAELELTRNEMAQTKLAMEEQAKTAEQQRQEQRFFDLLNVYYRTVNSISFPRRQMGPSEEASEKFEAKPSISAWLDTSPRIQKFLHDRGSAITGNGSDPNRGGSLHWIGMLVEWTDRHASAYFDSYFRVVRHLLSEAEGLLGNQQCHYVTFFCAQLSRTETILLALHLWLDPEGQEVQHLAGKYRLLRNLPERDLRTELESALPPEVFLNV